MELIIFFTMLILGYVFGRLAEGKHLKSIRRREQKYKRVLTYSTHVIPTLKSDMDCDVVVGNVVVSIDYFKKIAAGLRIIFGGRVKAYESLLDRARREAMLRMKEDALRKGGRVIFNVKLETASIYKGKKNQIGSVEVYAYGTALIPSSAA